GGPGRRGGPVALVRPWRAPVVLVVMAVRVAPRVAVSGLRVSVVMVATPVPVVPVVRDSVAASTPVRLAGSVALVVPGEPVVTPVVWAVSTVTAVLVVAVAVAVMVAPARARPVWVVPEARAVTAATQASV
ncbi:hypothetical protein OSH43_20935, partial [Mycobacterium ulcerans]